jgi:spore germination protein GerM
VLTVTVLTVTGIAGCGVQAESDAHRIARDAVPSELLRTTTTTTTSPPATVTTRPVLRSTLYFVRGEQITRVERQVDSLPSIADLVALLGQPTAEEAAQGLRTAVPAGRLVAAVSVSAGGATVDLDPSFAQTQQRLPALAFAQMTYTITTVPGVGLVTYTLGGAPIEVPAGDGSVAPAGPVSRDTYRNVLAT